MEHNGDNTETRLVYKDNRPSRSFLCNFLALQGCTIQASICVMQEERYQQDVSDASESFFSSVYPMNSIFLQNICFALLELASADA